MKSTIIFEITFLPAVSSLQEAELVLRKGFDYLSLF